MIQIKKSFILIIMTDNINDLIDKAFELHKNGKFLEAKSMYEDILNISPDNVEALNLYAQILSQFKEYDKAVELFEKLYNITSFQGIKYEIAKIYFLKNEFDISLEYLNQITEKNIDVYNLQSIIYTKLGQIDNAISSYRAILGINPDLYIALYNLSMLYKSSEKYDLALECALKAYALNNSDTSLILHLASLYDVLNIKDKMVVFLEKVLQQNPDNELLLVKLAIEYTALKDPVKSVAYYEKCLKINENNFEALVNLAALLIDIEKYDYAIVLAKRAISLSPANLRGYHVLFLIYRDKKDYPKAVEIAEKMIEIQPENHLGYGCLGDACYESVDYGKALECYNIALSILPDKAEYIYNKACCLNVLNREEEAYKTADELLSLYPDNYNAIMLKSFAALKRKKYDKAMETYPLLVSPIAKRKFTNTRFDIEHTFEKIDNYYKKNWNREDLSDKTLLLYNCDGYGDSIMFSRYIPLLKSKVKKLIVEIDKSLYDFYKYNFKEAEVICEADGNHIDYDFTTSYMSLFYNMQLGFDNIPFPEGWLNVDDITVKKFSESDIFNTQKLKAGIFWRGNKNILRNRFLNIEELIPLFEETKFKFYSLDIKEKSPEIIDILKKYDVEDCAPYINNFLDTAAILKNLDFVITIDSSVVHLAGALGVKTFLLLPNNPEWRWFSDDFNSPWYNSVRIFKQKRQSIWEDAVLDIKKELQDMPLFS